MLLKGSLVAIICCTVVAIFICFVSLFSVERRLLFAVYRSRVTSKGQLVPLPMMTMPSWLMPDLAEHLACDLDVVHQLRDYVLALQCLLNRMICFFPVVIHLYCINFTVYIEFNSWRPQMGTMYSCNDEMVNAINICSTIFRKKFHPAIDSDLIQGSDSWLDFSRLRSAAVASCWISCG